MERDKHPRKREQSVQGLWASLGPTGGKPEVVQLLLFADRVCMGRSAFMDGQFPSLGTEPAIEGCVRASKTALGLGAGCCKLGLEDSWDYGCLHSRESLPLTASAIMDGMETKTKCA